MFLGLFSKCKIGRRIHFSQFLNVSSTLKPSNTQLHDFWLKFSSCSFFLNRGFCVQPRYLGLNLLMFFDFFSQTLKKVWNLFSRDKIGRTVRFSYLQNDWRRLSWKTGKQFFKLIFFSERPKSELVFFFWAFHVFERPSHFVLRFYISSSLLHTVRARFYDVHTRTVTWAPFLFWIWTWLQSLGRCELFLMLLLCEPTQIGKNAMVRSISALFRHVLVRVNTRAQRAQNICAYMRWKWNECARLICIYSRLYSQACCGCYYLCIR